MNYNSPAMNNWLGHAFEEVVFNHIDQVKTGFGHLRRSILGIRMERQRHGHG